MESITHRGMRRALWSIVLTLASLSSIGGSPPDLHGQAPGGALGGVVLDDGTMEPIDAATVSIVGTNISAVTDERGTFVFYEPPVGRFSVRVVAADYVSVVQELELQAESVTHVQFFLPAIDAVVSELLVRQVPESQGTIKEPLSAVDVLARQVPGAFGALPMPGDTDQLVILRGLGTFSDNVEPVLLVDGIRVSAAGVYDALSQIPAEDVESIEVLRGAAGAFLHPNGANGVIQVRTRTGPRPGSN
ncbi:MAG: carboxypeptidase-like regulatory domain-containing protein [Gammaproteobacteria bacterium]|nr:carboxypeptidase-like regulatory domain-containing protein [Gammaproteobacteria bacterium]MDE0247520.1 carboxypeptidase-like regulatory domain-containing protein [Gammaproteobacteria bacterium]